MAAPKITREQLRSIVELTESLEHMSVTTRVYDTPASRRRRLSLMVKRCSEAGLTATQIIDVITS